jgi:hypothetical protein
MFLVHISYIYHEQYINMSVFSLMISPQTLQTVMGYSVEFLKCLTIYSEFFCSFGLLQQQQNCEYYSETRLRKTWLRKFPA